MLAVLFVGHQAFAADPWPPTNVTVNNITATSAVVSWVAPTNTGGSPILGYGVLDHIPLSGEAITSVTTGNSYSLNGLTPGHHTATVITITALGYSSSTGAIFGFDTDNSNSSDTIPPTAPTGVHVVGTASTTNTQIEWIPSTDVGGLAGYNVYAESNSNALPINTYLLPHASASFSNLAIGAYTRYVRAVDTAGNKSPAGSVSFVVVAPTGSVCSNGATNFPTCTVGAGSGGGYNFNVKFINPLCTDGGDNCTEDIPTLLNKILDALMLFLVPIVVVFIIYAGFLFVTAQGNETKLTKAKSVFGWTLVGAAILLGAKIIASVLSSTVTNILK